MEKASAEDLTKLKVTSLLNKLCDKSVTYAAGVEGMVADGGVLGDISGMINKNELALWLEAYPVEDFEYASAKYAAPYPGYRFPVMKF